LSITLQTGQNDLNNLLFHLSWN